MLILCTYIDTLYIGSTIFYALYIYAYGTSTVQGFFFFVYHIFFAIGSRGLAPIVIIIIIIIITSVSYFRVGRGEERRGSGGYEWGSIRGGSGDCIDIKRGKKRKNKRGTSRSVYEYNREFLTNYPESQTSLSQVR